MCRTAEQPFGKIFLIKKYPSLSSMCGYGTQFPGHFSLKTNSQRKGSENRKGKHRANRGNGETPQ